MSELPSARWLLEHDGRVREADSGARRFAPEHAQPGADLTSAFRADDARTVSAALARVAAGERVALDVALARADEPIVLVLEPEINGTARGVLALAVALAPAGGLAPADVAVIAHGISHDLGAHVRSLASFATFLEEDAGPALPPAAREDLTRTHGAIARLRAGLEGLVRYLRAPAEARGLGSVRESVLEAARSLDADFDARHSTLEVVGARVEDEDAWVPVATPVLTAVMRALLENAREQGGGRVRVVLSRDAERARITVGDGGRGLTADERERARLPFTRLRARVPGEVHPGLGLATVERAVRSVGGTLELCTSELGGLEVRLDLPVARPL